jgi:hypothetical protein
MKFDGVLPPMQPYFPIGEEFWKRPKNWKDLIELVNWATDDQVPIRLNAPRGIAMNSTTQLMKQRIFIHVVNYDRSDTTASKAIEVGVRLPGNRQPLKVTVRAPETKAAQPIDFAMRDAFTTFSLPGMRAYCVVKIEW